MFYDIIPEGYILRIRVTPNAAKCGPNGVFKDNTGTDYLKIGINAVPEKGKANQELIKFLSKYLKQSKSSFSILAGQTDRCKKILLTSSRNSLVEDLLNNMEKNNDSNNN